MSSARLILGDCRDEMRALVAEGARVHSVITDPPYGLVSVVKRFGKDGSAPARSEGPTGVFARASAGFMGQTWDGTGIEQDPEMWRLCFDLLHPGGHLLAFGGTRTWHRIAVAIEDAGFEFRDTIMWLYGSGFPKSHNVANDIDKRMGEPARGRAIPTASTHLPAGRYADEKLTSNPVEAYEARTPEGEPWQGWGTALKPAWEPILVFRKPLIGTVAANVLAHGTGALNIDGCRVEATDKTPAPVGQYGGSSIGPTGHKGVRDGSADHLGRWPANVAHDGSPEVEGAFAAFGERTSGAPGTRRKAHETTAMAGRLGLLGRQEVGYADAGSASRFFYCAKASKKDRGEGNTHPTVKPTELMRYLCRLVTPPGGTVFDPFMGSGSTGKAALAEGFSFIGTEQSEDYFRIAQGRVPGGAAKTFAEILAEATAARLRLTEAVGARI